MNSDALEVEGRLRDLADREMAEVDRVERAARGCRSPARLTPTRPPAAPPLHLVRADAHGVASPRRRPARSASSMPSVPARAGSARPTRRSRSPSGPRAARCAGRARVGAVVPALDAEARALPGRSDGRRPRPHRRDAPAPRRRAGGARAPRAASAARRPSRRRRARPSVPCRSRAAAKAATTAGVGMRGPSCSRPRGSSSRAAAGRAPRARRG